MPQNKIARKTARKAENKTQPTATDPQAFIAGVEPARRQQDARTLIDLMGEVTGFTPQMWGPSIIGFGRYHYRYKTGREGDSFATGFSPRKANLVLYVMPGYQDYGAIMDRLGKHRLGKSCLYLNKLADVDLEVLRELIATGVADLDKIWPVAPT